MTCQKKMCLLNIRTGNRKVQLEFVRFEPYVTPKKSLTGDSTEHVDTRVLQIIYRFKDPSVPFRVGQQMDVFIATEINDKVSHYWSFRSRPGFP